MVKLVWNTSNYNYYNCNFTERNRDWFCPFYKVIDKDELITTEHNTIFMSQFQVSDIVTAMEHSDLILIMAWWQRKWWLVFLTNYSRSVTLGSQVGLSCFIGKCASPKSSAKYPTISFLNVSRGAGRGRGGSTSLGKFPKKTFFGLLLKN